MQPVSSVLSLTAQERPPYYFLWRRFKC